jgi:murein DD-endopeptidase MepM/ murein hydrolase activator NlpD
MIVWLKILWLEILWKDRLKNLPWDKVLPLGFLVLFLAYSWIYYSPNFLNTSPVLPVSDIKLSAKNAKVFGLDNSTETTAAKQPEHKEFHATIVVGDSISSIISPWLSQAEIHLMTQSAKDIFRLARIRQGQPYVVYAAGDTLSRFEYEIDPASKLVVVKGEQGFNSGLEKIEYDIVLHRVQGAITSNLFAAMSESGEKALLAAALADVFAWEINFIRDLRVGDSYTFLVEKRYRDGEFKNYGKILAARFTNQDVTYDAFLFTDNAGRSHYFSSKGESLRRAFLKAPLAFNRISSGYSNRRLHPILQTWRAHPAIDYAAPVGTPVKSVGKGTVTQMGYNQTAGNFVKISHMNNYETTYMHLSSFAKGLHKGSSVSQGQVIAFVGKTGYATGPHLDFRMKKNGTFVNPLKELTPREHPVTADELPSFMTLQENYREFLDEKRKLAEYTHFLLN